jgi:hypothetical protein
MRKHMTSYIEKYDAKFGEGITLHTWTDVQGRRERNFYITGMSGTAVASWFRGILRTKHLADMDIFPTSASAFYA